MNATVEIWYKLEKKVWKYSKDSQLLIHECMKRRKLEIWQRKIEIKQEAIDVYFDKVSGWKWISTKKSLKNKGPTLRRKRKELVFFYKVVQNIGRVVGFLGGYCLRDINRSGYRYCTSDTFGNRATMLCFPRFFLCC